LHLSVRFPPQFRRSSARPPHPRRLPRPPPSWRRRTLSRHQAELRLHCAWSPCFPDLLPSSRRALVCAHDGRAPPLLRAAATTPPPNRPRGSLVRRRGNNGAATMVAGVAASGGQPCSNRRPALLQWVAVVAPMSGQACYDRRPPLLQRTAGLATIAARPCYMSSRRVSRLATIDDYHRYKWWPVLLQGQPGRCYSGTAGLLPAAAVVATKAHLG
jgi:hypothetical protein